MLPNLACRIEPLVDIDATKMEKMLINAYKMLEKGQHMINPATKDMILKTAGPVPDASQSQGIGIWSVSMTAIMWPSQHHP